jgi:L-lactate dehydrogenase (FMN-dependent) and related alpha-hydroxy acid dehydrogenases
VKISEVRTLLQLRKPERDRVERTLKRCVTIEDLQHAAWRRWPKSVRGYVEGGADGEVSLARNRAAYESVGLVPSPLRDVTDVDLRTSILGGDSALPFALAPTGYTRMMHTAGEGAVARAARDAGIPYTMSTMATTRLENVAAEVGGDLWFQLYVWRDRGLVRELIERAKTSGYRALMLTVDTPVTGLRVRDAHNGFTIPPQLSASTVLDMARHPMWCASMLAGPPITYANFAPEVGRTPEGLMEFAAKQFDPSVSWDDLAWIRGLWQGPLMVKGLVSESDAARAVEVGVDAVVLSNHGGRQLDQVVVPLQMIPAVRDRVGDKIAVFVDSGIRRGSDIAVALALGADAVLIGRPYLYGLGAAGERGVAASISMLGAELCRAMTLMGVTSVAQLRAEGPALVRWPSAG